MENVEASQNHVRSKAHKKLKKVWTDHLTSKHLKVGFKKLTCPYFFNPLLGGWKSDETRFLVFGVSYQTQDTVFHHISNTEKRVENTTGSRVFLTNVEGFDIVVKHCDECVI